MANETTSTEIKSNDIVRADIEDMTQIAARTNVSLADLERVTIVRTPMVGHGTTSVVIMHTADAAALAETAMKDRLL
ncbi:hypothetical protein [Nonomuraea sp. CA-141351]|uniref:hypothetical protein n=1 Tax=Nonomuraea sp. CA-141351 TaxID=3239996 RepID=UPI003D8B7042